MTNTTPRRRRKPLPQPAYLWATSHIDRKIYLPRLAGFTVDGDLRVIPIWEVVRHG